MDLGKEMINFYEEKFAPVVRAHAGASRPRLAKWFGNPNRHGPSPKRPISQQGNHLNREQYDASRIIPHQRPECNASRRMRQPSILAAEINVCHSPAVS